MATIEKLEGSKVKFTIEVTAEDFETAVEKAYIKTRKNITVPGFRKGHAPRKVIENMYGWGVFFEDAFDIVYPDAYEAAVKEHGVVPVDQPDVSIKEGSEGKPVVFEAVVVVKPEVTLGQYKGIEAEKQEYNVTDEMVEAEIDHLRDERARMVGVERPVEKGDEVELDYRGTVDGVAFDGGTAENQKLIIGSDTFIPGFEEQMIGMNADEERDLSVKFPDEYHSSELAGKDAVFHVKVNSISVKELPDADDDFAEEADAECHTIAELRDKKRRELTEKAEKDAKIAKENTVIRKAVDNATVDIPDAMIQRQMDRMMNDIRYRLSMQGISLEDYCKYTGADMNAMREEMRADAATRVKSQLVLEAIGKAENIASAPEDIDSKVDEYCAQFGDKAAEFKEKLTADDKLYFEDQVILDKTIELMTSTAVEVEPKAEQKPDAEAKE